MSNSKSYAGEYKLVADSIPSHFTIPTIVVAENSESVELTQSGIKTKTRSFERLLSLQLAAVLSARCASDWTALKFDHVAEFADGKNLPRRIVADASVIPNQMNEKEYRRTLPVLLGLDRASLLFLLHASEMLGNHRDLELAILAALLALEVELNRIVPQRLNMAAKLACLAFAEVTSTESLARLRRLNNLRNRLAHGNWTRDNLGESLVKLLGGKHDDWLLMETAWVNAECARRVFYEVITALSDLLRAEETLRQVRARIRSINTPLKPPTA